MIQLPPIEPHLKQRWSQLCDQAALPFSPDALEKALGYLALLQKWNKAYNLTAIDSMEKMMILHLMDSFSIVPFLKGNRIADVGTGAGLPGIPLALVCPDRHFTLIESSQKKCQFLLQAVLALGLKNVDICNARVESYKPEQKFDTIISRAFSSLQMMLDLTPPLCAQGRQFLAMKGAHPETEISMIPADFKVSAIHRLSVVGLSAERHVIILNKTASHCF